ncbi:MAG: FAD-binding oxidoreductase [Betaproteobacteria bacterium]
MNINQALAEWRGILGDSRVLNSEAAARAYSVDASGYHRRIAGALKISDATTLPAIVSIASHLGVPIYPISTGRNWGYGTSLPVRDDCVIIDLGELNRILNFDAELGVVTLEPGVTQEQLAQFLDQGAHPFLVPVTGAGPTCSLVGNALERGYGITPHADHFGAVSDLEAVLADGSIYRTALREAGGEDLARLFKWGLGPYSAGLFTQSGFGIVTRLTIALARRPEQVKAFLFSLRSDDLLEAAVERIRRILGALPGTVGAVNLMNQRRVLAMSSPFPVDQLDTQGMIPETLVEKMGRQYQIFPWTGLGTLYGTRRIVKAAQGEIRRALSGVANRLIFLSPAHAQTLANLARILPGAGGQKLARTVGTLAKSLQLVAGRPNETALPLCYWRNPASPTGAHLDPARDGCGLIWYAPLVPMRPPAVREYVETVKRVALSHRMEPLITFTSVSDKIFDSTVPLIFERDNPQAQQSAEHCYHDLLSAGREIGCFPYRVGINTMETLGSAMKHSRVFHSRLRAVLDPGDILSPGRYG